MKEEKEVEASPPEKALIKKKIMREALKRLKPEAIKAIPQSEIQQDIDKALEGLTDYDLAMAMEYSSLLCARCGECCRHSDPIVLTPGDVDVLTSLLGIERLGDYVTSKDGRFIFRKTKPCAFLQKNKCMIYDHRPFICRAFPLDDRTKNGALTLALYKYCKFTVNLMAYKVKGMILRRLMDPRLAQALEISEKKFAEQLEHKTQQERFLLLREHYRRLEKLMSSA